MEPLQPPQVIGLTKVFELIDGVVNTVIICKAVSASHGPVPSGSFEINRIVTIPEILGVYID